MSRGLDQMAFRCPFPAQPFGDSAMVCSNANFWLNHLPQTACAKQKTEAAKCDRRNHLGPEMCYDTKKTIPNKPKDTTAIRFECVMKKYRMRSLF